MEEVDRHRIRTNLIELIKETHYDSLIDSIERVDRQKVIPSRLLADWKVRLLAMFNDMTDTFRGED